MNEIIFPNSHAGCYPGAKMIDLKVIFRKSDRKLFQNGFNANTLSGGMLARAMKGIAESK